MLVIKIQSTSLVFNSNATNKSNSNAIPCDSLAPTIYNDPSNPPCCVQVLRDMAAAFDSIMCTLGFEYVTSYGTLLGLVRNDTLIPWTADNDFIITEHTLAAMYDISPEEKQVWNDHGLDFFFANFYHRVCIMYNANIYGWGIGQVVDIGEQFTMVSSCLPLR